MTKITIILCAASFLSSCSIKSDTFYKPIGKGEYTHSCGGSPDTTLIWKVNDGLHIAINEAGTVYKKSSNGPPTAIGITYYLEEGHTLKLAQTELEIRLHQPSKIIKLPLGNFSYSIFKRIDDKGAIYSTSTLDPPVDGEIITKGGEYKCGNNVCAHYTYEFPPMLMFKGAKDTNAPIFQRMLSTAAQARSYYVTAKLPIIDKSFFYIRLPSVFLDGRNIELQEIEFKLITQNYLRSSC